jgi:hypothetical protein
MTHSRRNSSGSANFRDALLQERFEAIQWHKYASADARDANAVVGDAIVDRANTDSESLRCFRFRERQWPGSRRWGASTFAEFRS